MTQYYMRPIGGTGLSTAPLGLGCAHLWGMDLSADTEEIVRCAWALGFKLIDTAPRYGMGDSERRLGAALRAMPRDDFVVATKAGFDISGKIARTDYSYDGILRSVNGSLLRLGIDTLDILWVHDPDDHVQEVLDDGYRALECLKAEGKVQAIGVAATRCETLVQLAKEAHWDAFLVAGRYTLLDQRAIRELLPICAQRSIAVVIGAVFNSGILATGTVPGACFDYVPATEYIIRKFRRIEEIAAQNNVSMRAAALQLPLAHSSVCCVLTGSRQAGRLHDNQQSLADPIPQQFWDELRGQGLLEAEVPVPRRELAKG